MRPEQSLRPSPSQVGLARHFVCNLSSYRAFLHPQDIDDMRRESWATLKADHAARQLAFRPVRGDAA